MKQLENFLTEDEGVAAPDEAVVETPDAPIETPDAVAKVAPPPEPVKPEPEAADDADAVPEDVRGLRGALQAVRREKADYKGERDTLKGEMAALKAQLAELQKPAPAAPQPPPQPVQAIPRPNQYEDPEGHEAWLEARMEARATLIAAKAVFNDRLLQSENRFRKDAPADLDDAIEAFKQAADASPKVQADFAASDDPFKFAYTLGKASRAMADPVGYEASVRADERVRARAEWDGEASGRTAPAVVLPRSLSSATAAAPRMPEEEEPIDFDSIFERKRKR